MSFTFTERFRQARLYAAQVRQRRAMGDQYAHAPVNVIRRQRRLLSAKIEEAMCTASS